MLAPPDEAPRLIDRALALLFAPACAACEALLTCPSASPVCGACWANVVRDVAPRCARCGVPAPLGSVCHCPQIPAGLDWLRSVGPYDGSLRAILHALKYDGRQTLAAPLAALARHVLQDVPTQPTLVVPVPLHGRKVRARGFNQADLLARYLGLPVAPLLRRLRDTASQTALDRQDRRANVVGAFAVSRPRWPWQRSVDIAALRFDPTRDLVLLVDDVMTTGATLAACARALHEHGLRHVAALTIARTP